MNLKQQIFIIIYIIIFSSNAIKPMETPIHLFKKSINIICYTGIIYTIYVIICYFFFPKKIQSMKTSIIDLNKKQIYIIKARGKGTIYFSQAHADYANDNINEYISLSADENIINNLEITTDTNCLRIEPKLNNAIENSAAITYNIVLKNICHIKLHDMINVNFTTNIKVNELHLILKDNTQVSSQKNCDINLDFLTATCSESSSVYLKGYAGRQQIYLSDSAHYDAKDLKSYYTYLEGRGSGKVKINVKKDERGIYKANKGTIEGFITDKRELEYKGNPDLSTFECKDSAVFTPILEQKNKILPK